MNSKIEVVAGVIIREDGAILITQRPAGKAHALLWEFPGGKREPDETWEEALYRELAEELGIQVRLGDLFHESVHEHDSRELHFKFFLAELLPASPEPQAIGCPALVWTSPRNLANYSFPEADREVVQRLIFLSAP